MVSAQILNCMVCEEPVRPRQPFNVMDVFAGIIESATLVSFQHYYTYYWYLSLPLIYSDT